MNDLINLKINGESYQLKVKPNLLLLDLLRDNLGLTGTKRGCDTGECGACTVLLEGKPINSCLMLAVEAEGKDILTIEGLAKNGQLHPLQEAFIKTGAFQCGFCTPGMLLSAKALLDANSNPQEEEIKKAMAGNICRCTGYVKIIDAVNLAVRWLSHPEERVDLSITGIGKSLTDTDGVAKVTGSLPFADDLYLENMLYGKIVWSEYPHAEILAVETETAKAAAGVAAVLTAKDIPGLNAMGSLKADKPVLCGDRVRFLGDMVAVVSFYHQISRS